MYLIFLCSFVFAKELFLFKSVSRVNNIFFQLIENNHSNDSNNYPAAIIRGITVTMAPCGNYNNNTKNTAFTRNVKENQVTQMTGPKWLHVEFGLEETPQPDCYQRNRAKTCNKVSWALAILRNSGHCYSCFEKND